MAEDNLNDNQDSREPEILDFPQPEQEELNEAPIDEQAREAQARYAGLPYWRKVLAVLIIFVILVLLFLAGRGIYHKFHHTAAPANPPTAVNQPPQQSGAKSPSSAPSGSGNQKSGVGSSETPPTNVSGKSGQLPNSGPGDVMALFTGTSLTAAGLHYFVTQRRNKDE